MNYADIRPIDVANGPGIRVSLFVSGCTHACPECFNPEAWDFQYGAPFGPEQVEGGDGGRQTEGTGGERPQANTTRSVDRGGR